MDKTPVENMNDFKEEVAKLPKKDTDNDNSEVNDFVEIDKKESYADSPADRARTNKGPIGIDRDADF